MLPIEKEISKKIKEYEERIVELFVPDSFILSSEIVELRDKIYELQQQCPHSVIVNGVCTCCGKENN